MQASGGERPARGTLNQLFFDAVSNFNRPDALQVKVGGSYKPISHKELESRVRRAAIGLAKLGAQPGDRFALLSENRPEWATVETGELVDVPGGVKHAFRSVAAEPVVELIVTTPRLGRFFQ